MWPSSRLCSSSILDSLVAALLSTLLGAIDATSARDAAFDAPSAEKMEGAPLDS